MCPTEADRAASRFGVVVDVVVDVVNVDESSVLRFRPDMRQLERAGASLARHISGRLPEYWHLFNQLFDD